MISRRFRRTAEQPYRISLTSLMDIVTNILVYTIKIFAISPIVIGDPSIILPKSTTKTDAENSVIVMITGLKQNPKIVVDGKVVNIPENAKNHGYIIKNLKAELLNIRKNQQQSASFIKGAGFTGRVVIVADKHTPYRVLVDVLATCGDAGFGNFEFAVVKQEA